MNPKDLCPFRRVHYKGVQSANCRSFDLPDVIARAEDEARARQGPDHAYSRHRLLEHRAVDHEPDGASGRIRSGCGERQSGRRVKPRLVCTRGPFSNLAKVVIANGSGYWTSLEAFGFCHYSVRQHRGSCSVTGLPQGTDQSYSCGKPSFTSFGARYISSTSTVFASEPSEHAVHIG
jgi:hypothetical protein